MVNCNLRRLFLVENIKALLLTNAGISEAADSLALARRDIC